MPETLAPEGDVIRKPRKPDPRIARTNQLLAQSLRQLLGDQCFEDITIQDILDKSTINRATFYAHFQDKDALLHFILLNIFEEALHEKLAPNAAAVPQNLDRLILAVCDFFGKVRRCARLSTIEGNPHVEAAIKPGVHKVIAGWLRGLTGQADFDTELAAAAATWTICGAAVRWNKWNRTATPVPAEEFLEKLRPLLRPSLDLILLPDGDGGLSPREKPMLGYPNYADELGMI